MTEDQNPAALAVGDDLSPEVEKIEGAPPAETDQAETNDTGGAEVAAEEGGETPAETEKESRSRLRREQRKARMESLIAENQRLHDELARRQRDEGLMKPAEPEPAPRRDQFDDPDEFIAARAAWQVQQTLNKQQAQEAEARRRALQEQQAEIQKAQIAEATAAAVLASAIVSSAGGVFWLIVALPTRLTSLEANVQQLVRLVGSLEPRLDRIELKVNEHDRRLERLE